MSNISKQIKLQGDLGGYLNAERKYSERQKAKIISCKNNWVKVYVVQEMFSFTPYMQLSLMDLG